MTPVSQRIEQLSPEKRALLLARLKERSKATAGPATITPRDERDRFPLSFAQRRMWILNQMEPDSPFYNIAIGLRLKGPLNVPVLERSLNEVIRRHDVLRARFVVQDGSPIQLVEQDIALPLPIVNFWELPDAWQIAQKPEPPYRGDGGTRSDGRDRQKHRTPLSEDSATVEEVLERYGAAEARRVFDLSTAPLVRGQLVRIAEDDHAVMLVLHHIVADGWSMGVLIREMALLYEAFRDARLSPLSELPIQYADYATWESQWLLSRDSENGSTPQEMQLAYWKDQLVGIPPLLELPTDHPRPAIKSGNGATYRFRIDAEVVEGLRTLGHQEQATLYMALLAAFQALLHRYSGEDDICVGTPVANRSRPEVEDLIGLFVNTVVIRTQFTAGLTFRELLRQVREAVLAAQANQELPFETLVDALKPERDLGSTPLFQVAFDLDNRPASGFRLPGLSLNPIETHSRTAKFDLTLFMSETGNGLDASLEYSTDLWQEESIGRMAGALQQLLRSIVADAGQRISRLLLLAPEDRDRLVSAWNDTVTPYPAHKPLQTLFEEQVERTPDAVSVSYHGHHLTYGELNRRANRLAYRLRELDIGPSVPVGLYLERSLNMMIGLLGIVKAGGTYLPLDPEYPADRVSFMLEDARASVLLTQTSLVDSLQPPADPDHRNKSLTVICLDEDCYPTGTMGAIGKMGSDGVNPPVLASSQDLAYIIYTSGSTGVPKGVSIPQSAIARLVRNTNYMTFGSQDRIAQISNASFDAATFEIWGAWLNGGQLIGVPKEIALSVREFARTLRLQHITALFTTTALFNVMAGEVPDAFETLQWVLFGGEAVDPRSVRTICLQGMPRNLIHVYGPTESTTFASWFPVTQVSEDARTVPIGLPLANTQLYVLDQEYQPVPAGVHGQLFIGGDGLARDYLNRPEVTAGRFVPNPWVDIPGSRMYATGDLVKQQPDGNIVFVGRVDYQVKIRGFRIEPGEIETVLRTHPKVGEVLISTVEPDTGEDRVSRERALIAFVVPKSIVADGSINEPSLAPSTANANAPSDSAAAETGPAEVLDTKALQELGVDELRSFVRKRLPEYMVPAYFVVMESFPLNPNGKVDRKALLDQAVLLTREQRRQQLGRPYVAPRTPLEAYLARKWQEVLGVEEVGVYDNFFELGGNSLHAAVLVNRLQEESGQTTHVRALFMAPTIADLAIYIAEYYPETAAKLSAESEKSPSEISPITSGLQEISRASGTITAGEVEDFRRLIPALEPLPRPLAAPPNPPAVFILSPPRSGSTLLRVMLAGNQRLFSPPELDLLSFNTLKERRAAFSGKYSFWLEGPIRAIMEVKGCSADEAIAIMTALENQDLSTQQFYKELQGWIGNRLLVDKTPVYALDIEILRRAQQYFRDPFFIHLTRHPYASIYSFVEAKLDELFFRHRHDYTLRELAELVWVVSHQNILKFLEAVPPQRQYRVSFEQLVSQPKNVMEGICSFLGIPYHPDMMKPYEGDKMTSGLSPDRQMVGDFKFYLRDGIDPKAADRWQRLDIRDSLGQVARTVSQSLDYELEEARSSSGPDEALGVKRTGSDGLTSGQPRLPRIEPGQGEAKAPLSYPQLRLWFLDQLTPESAFYNVPAAMRITGRLSLAALEQSLNEIVRRHEALRTTFLMTAQGEPQQIIAPQLTVDLPLIDLSHLPQQQREHEIHQLAEDEARRAFDLSSGPLLRVTLLRLDAEDHVVLLTMHHIVSDGWSATVFVRELAALYDAFVDGSWRPELPATAPLPPLPIQYADYATWQRQLLEVDAADGYLQNQLAYWLQQLADSPPLMELPTDRPRPPVQTLNGARIRTHLPKPLAEAVKALGQQEDCTLFMTLLAAFNVLLHRYSGQDCILVGTPIANRNLPELEPLIGFFVNTLVLRTDLRSANAGALPTFRQLLRQVRRVAVEAYAHPDVPFEMLVDELQPERNMSHTPLFQVMFTLQDAPMRALKLSGATLTPLPVDSGTAKFDLLLAIVQREDGLLAELEYNTDLFDTATSDRLLGHYQSLLQAAVAQPDLPVTRLPMLTAQERTTLANWNQTTASYPAQDTIPGRFEAQALSSPHAAAVVYDDQVVTFDHLNRRANRLAHLLAECNVQPDTLVAIALERSTDLLVAVLGILKAGAAYLPLDPTYPWDRLAFMLQDSQARLLITQQSLSHRLPTDPKDTILLDAAGDDLARYPDTDPGCRLGEAQPQNLAYVIYTSGSTGRPKGVMIQHRSALNLAAALQQTMYQPLPWTSRPRISLNAPLSFDASVQQLVMLTHGHTLVIIPDDVRTDAQALLDTIRRQRLDQLDCVPTQLKLLLDAGFVDDADQWTPTLVFPGGEAIDGATWKRIAHAPTTDFFNVYGPTEATVDVTTANARLFPGQPTIGRPLPNTRLYVLDRHGQQAPVGIPGELCIAGPSVARGYLHRPSLTAERFTPNPVASLHEGPEPQELPAGSTRPGTAGDRIYRTGDLVRFLPDGNLQFLGRIDHQVKVRGFRIELGEIEATLRRHPAIADAVATVRSDAASGITGDPAGPRLVAYLVLASDQMAEPATAQVRPTVGELRAFLLQTLPDYMVPAAFVTLDRLPLTPNGKVDRRALPAADQADQDRLAVDSPFQAPRTAVEERLAAIWAQTLGLERVGIHDNFFELGGDSILSLQIIARANQAGLQLSPRHVFEAPTIAQLAALAGTGKMIDAQQGVVTGPVPLTPIQHRFFQQNLPRPDHWNQSLLLITDQEPNLEHLNRAVAALVQHHDALRLRAYQRSEGWHLENAGVTDATPFDFVDLSGNPDAELSKTIQKKATALQASFDLERGPLMRVAYFHLGLQKPGRLLIVVHHLAVDALSWRILLEDLQTAYVQLSQGRPVRLPAKTTAFQDWARRLVKHANSRDVTAQLSNWQHLAAVEPFILPTDFLRGPNDEKSARSLHVAFSLEESQDLLRSVSSVLGTDLGDILLATLAQTLAVWTGSQDLLIAAESHGREDIFLDVDLSRTVGWFTALYPLRLQLTNASDTNGSNLALLAVVEQVKRQAEAARKLGLSYGLLRYLNSEPEVRAVMQMIPEPQLSFNYLGHLDAATRPSALPFRPAPETPGYERSPQGLRQFLIDVTASVVEGQLRLAWQYSSNLHEHGTIQRLAESWSSGLRSLINHCRQTGLHQMRADIDSDAEQADVSQQDLEAILAEISS